MKQEFHLCIIIPAFNEASKLDIRSYREFLTKNSKVALVFVNDASNDDTLRILEDLKIEYPLQLKIISNPTNEGKGESVRHGMQYAFETLLSPKYAFLDADLATSLKECLQVAHTVKGDIEFSFGSRILTVDSNIERKAYRHYIGRVVATAISKTLRLEVYDTQCGCKVFSESLAKNIFEEPFISRWLFDVELFFRTMQEFGRDLFQRKTHEHALKQWIDKGESKVKFSYFFKLWLDLWKIKARYRKV